MSVRGGKAPLLDAVLAGRACCAEETGDAESADLFPEEEALVARAVPARRREFATARLCARRALAALGAPPAPLLRGRRGAPAWPVGVIGSITHCMGFRGAAVAPADRVLALGIDAEPHAPLPRGVLGAVAFGPERARLRVLAARRADICWDRLLFSAKESVYKAWSGYGGAWLGFEDADTSWRLDEAAEGPRGDAPVRGEEQGLGGHGHLPVPRAPARAGDGAGARGGRSGGAAGRFRARILVPPPPVRPDGPPFPQVLHGRWLVRDGLLLTAVTVPRTPLPRPTPTAPKEPL
ncbi:4'-phosphopantetheinyl transferase [Streptomyces sp. NPDC058872]|uniref:4'-phosphopantetheinyl transferase family protein n=1 Tax=Streptomyces sp. NPDC058872 TaxID=3346661 RepID=UPI0036B82E31